MNEFHRVGVIGLGRMGLPMARHLQHAGFEVAGFDLDPARGAALAEGGGVAAASAKEVAAYSQAVLVMVADDAQVRAVTLEPVGVLSGLHPGGVVIIASTVRPSPCREVAAAAAARGVGVLDAPVAKGQRAAETGTLTVFVGGEAGLFQRCQPILRAFGTEIIHIDTQVGAGQVAKLANNLILWATVAGVHEALGLAEQLGVSPPRLRAALRHGSADSYALRELHLINLTWPDQDVAQAVEIATEAGTDAPLANWLRTLMRTLTREELRRLSGAAPGVKPDSEGRQR